MIKGVHHVGISTRNLEELRRFYCESFGFEPVVEMSWQSGTELGAQCDRVIGLTDSSAKTAMISRDGVIIEMFEYSSPEPKPKAPGWRVCDYGYSHICIEVGDIDEEYERLMKAGMTFHVPPPAEPYNGIKAVYGRDPEGNIIEIMELCNTDQAAEAKI